MAVTGGMQPTRIEPQAARWQDAPAERAAALQGLLAEQSRALAELQARSQALAERGATLEQARAASERRADGLRARAAPVRERLQRTRAQLASAEQACQYAADQLTQLRGQHEGLLASTLWRAGWPLRRLARLLRRAPPDPPPALPSTLFRAADPRWSPPAQRTDFTRLTAWQPRARIAVVAHVFYPELWPELADAIEMLAEPFDLFVTLVAGAAEAVDVRERFAQAVVIVVDNHGRDILPFLELVRTGVLARYELVCKLHTKRSLWHVDGEAWRHDLIAGVLGSRNVGRAIPAAFRADAALGLVVADGHIYAGRELWVGNERHLTRLFRPFGLDRSAFDRSFAGGSMFWLRASLLQGLALLDLQFDDFEREPLAADGSMAHAVERLISLLCYHAGATVVPTSAVLASAAGGTSRT